MVFARLSWVDVGDGPLRAVPDCFADAGHLASADWPKDKAPGVVAADQAPG